MSETATESGYGGTDELSMVVVSLLKGVLYQEDRPEVWNSLLGLQAQVGDYLAVLGLDLVVDEAEGYAFLRSFSEDEEQDSQQRSSQIPRLIRRQQLSFPVSLLLALLRKKLAEFDAVGGDTRLILSRDDIIELFRVFLPAGTNEVKLVSQMDTHLNKVARLGFIRPLRGQKHMFEIRRILKAFVDAQWLKEFDTRLAEYQAHLQEKGENSDG